MTLIRDTGTLIVFGNGGELIINARGPEQGQVLHFEPSEETIDGDHGGYDDVVSVDLNEWCTFYECAADNLPDYIDILDIDCLLANGEVVKAEQDYRNEFLSNREPHGAF